jgi:hypothetical protein
LFWLCGITMLGTFLVLTNVVQFSLFQAKNWCVGVGYMDPWTGCSQTSNFDLEPSLCEKKTQIIDGPSWTTISYLLVILGYFNILELAITWVAYCIDCVKTECRHSEAWIISIFMIRVIEIMCPWNFQLSITCTIPIIILGKSFP